MLCVLVILGVIFVVGSMLLWLGFVFCDSFILIILICGLVVCFVNLFGLNVLLLLW